MNYEELYAALQPLEKQMKEATAAAQKSYKAVAKYTESGDLKALNRELANYAALLETQAQTAKELSALTEGFNAKEYFENGEFTEQMLAFCREQDVNIVGEYPVFEAFPYRIRFDAENTDIYLNRKRLSCARPLGLVKSIKENRERLMKASFNAQTFLNELADAYDSAIAIQKKPDGADLYLVTLYKLMVPMGRFRREYDMQSFSYEIARLYGDMQTGTEPKTTKDGRGYQFGPSRKINKAIRILDADGHEQYLATIRFFR